MSKQAAQSLDAQGRRRLTPSGKRALLLCCACIHCCGDTPAIMQVRFPAIEYVQWFNEQMDARCRTFLSQPDGKALVEYRLRYPNSDQLDDDAIVVNLNCNTGTTLDPIGTVWAARIDSPVVMEGRVTYQHPAGEQTDWIALPGYLDMLVSVGQSPTDATKKIILFSSGYVFKPGVALPTQNEGVGSPGCQILASFEACPLDCMAGRSLPSSGIACGPYAPGPGVTFPGTIGVVGLSPASNRSDCTHDCDGTPPPTVACPKCADYLAALGGCGADSLVIFGGTNVGFSVMDFFTFADLVCADDDTLQSIVYRYNGSEGNIYFQITCFSGSPAPSYYVRLDAPKPDGLGSYTVERMNVQGDSVTGLPPNPITINAGNASIWDPPPDVTEVTMGVAC